MRRPTRRDVDVWEQVAREFNLTWRAAGLETGCSRAPRRPTLEELDRGGPVALDGSTGLLTLAWRRSSR